MLVITYSKCIEYKADFLRVFQMKNDFKRMEDEMDHLATNMESITEFSGRISSTLQDRRQQITKLSGVHSLLKKVIIKLCDSWEWDTFFYTLPGEGLVNYFLNRNRNHVSNQNFVNDSGTLCHFFG